MKFISSVLLIFIITLSIFSGSVFAAANLTLTNKIYNSTPIYGAENYQYITITNNGPDAATNVVVNVPRSFNTIEWWTSNDNQVSYIKNNTSFTPATGVWNIGNLASGKSLFLDIRMLINRTGSVTNTATATADNANTVTSAWTINTPASPTPNINLGLTSSFNYTNPSPGSANTLKITVTIPNWFTSATGIVVNDGMPTDITITGWRVYDGSSWTTSDSSYSSWTGIWNVGDIFSWFGESRQLEINFLTPSTAGTTQVISTVYGAQNDPNLTNNYAAAYFTVPVSLNAFSVSGQLPQARTLTATQSDSSSTQPDVTSASQLAGTSLNVLPALNIVNTQNLKGYFTGTSPQNTGLSGILSNLLNTLLSTASSMLNNMQGMLP